MRLSTCGLVSAAVLAAVAAVSPAHAQRAPEWNFCDAKTPPDIRIQNCTVLAESRGESQRNRAVAYHFRAMAWGEKRDYDRAIADYDQPIRLEPKDINVYNNRGNIWKAKGDYDRAIADYDEAIRLDPKDAVAYNNRSIVWRTKGENDRAIADCTEAIRLDPKYASPYYNRGLAKQAKGDASGADADIAAARQINPNIGIK